MAYAKPVSTFSVTSVLLFLFSSPSHSTSNNDAASKVNLSLYYESLCPYCENFIVNQLRKVFESDLISVINLQLVPWGNSNTQRIINTNWTCQLELRHAYETEHLQPPQRFVPWVLVNNKALEQVGPFSSLFHPLSLSLSLSTHSTFRVQDYGNYITHACQAYTGQNRPAACNAPPEINSSEIANSIPQVCYPRKCVNF